MTLDIVFGVAEQHSDEDGNEYPWVEWLDPLPEEDGVDEGCSICAGRPERSVPWGGVAELLAAMPQIAALLKEMGWDGGNDPVCLPIHDKLALFDAIPTDPAYWRKMYGDRMLSRNMADRAVFFRYWPRRAVELYGERAVMGIR